jgi:hypothetical protein
MNIVCHGRLDLPASGQAAEKGCCEHGAEHSVPVVFGKLSSQSDLFSQGQLGG